MSHAPRFTPQASFEESLVGDYAIDSVIDMTELSIDNLMNSDLIKNIPIVKMFAGIAQTTISIRDHLLLKKVMTFLVNTSKISESRRMEMIADVNKSPKYKLRVGEKLLYLLDSCDDHESAALLAKVFIAFLDKIISYDEFLRAAHVIAINRASTIINFISADNEVIDMYKNEVEIATGLYAVYSEKVSVDVRENDDWKYNVGGYIADVGDGGLWANPSQAGEIIKKVFEGKKK